MTIREIDASAITDAVAKLAIEATHFLPADVEGAIRSARSTERSPLAEDGRTWVLAVRALFFFFVAMRAT